MKVLDIGTAIYVFDEIAYATKNTEKNNQVNIVLKGNPTSFIIEFDSTEEIEKFYEALCKEIKNNKQS